MGLLLLFPVLWIVCAIHISLYALDQTAQMERKANQAERYLISQEVRHKRAEWESLLQKQEQLWCYEVAEKDIWEQAASKPILSADFLEELNSVMGSTAEILWEESDSIRYSDGVLTFSAKTEKAQEASACVQKLEESGIYERVEYEGFESVEEAETGVKHYRFRVTCYIGSVVEGGKTS